MQYRLRDAKQRVFFSSYHTLSLYCTASARTAHPQPVLCTAHTFIQGKDVEYFPVRKLLNVVTILPIFEFLVHICHADSLLL